MCGIIGFSSCETKWNESAIKDLVSRLLVLSETRGKEASGAAVFTPERLRVIKKALPAVEMIKLKEYSDLFSGLKANSPQSLCIIGHSRLVTNGTQYHPNNNQPVEKEAIVTVHNGIVVNVDSLWKENPELEQQTEVDTEIITALYEKYRKTLEPIGAFQQIYRDIYGMANLLNILPQDNKLIAATNNGSIYYCWSHDKKSILFASEALILKRLLSEDKLACSLFSSADIRQMNANTGLLIDLSSMEASTFSFDCYKPMQTNVKEKERHIEISSDMKKYSRFEIDPEPIHKLRRCTRCVLPETMPFIEFDEEGVCNYCRTYKKQKYKGKDALESWAAKTRRTDKKADTIVSFSGGRDSSYGLHYFVKELGLHPVCFSYDWGMVTDLARRNQSRMCASLGVELIVVSANIAKKRDNIRRNVTAWLKKPDLGMVPIFMAGDKQYFYYANQVRKDLGLNEVLMASNPFEKTHFKSGFCGARPSILKQKGEGMALEQLDLGSIFRMAGHYAKQYLQNPSYINRSVLDTASATMCYYAIPHNYFRLYEYIPWDEKTVNDVLLNQYDWEISPDSDSTWRIGDGTAPFYNYIYYCVAGFTENDTLRSNQIREGMLSRTEALKLVEKDNMPRFDSMKWYFDVIGVDMEEALTVVNKMKKLYIP